MKKLLLPMIIGALLYIFLLLGENADLISKHTIPSLVIMAGMAALLYVVIFGYIRNEANFYLGYAGFLLIKLALALGIPVFLIVYKLNAEPVRQPESLPGQNQIEFVTDSKKCAAIQYGSFVNGTDTIVRFTKDGSDFESIKHQNVETIYRIKWLDNCTYYRIDRQSSVVKAIVKMGNFESDKHTLYTKPAGMHAIEEEQLEVVYEVGMP